MVFMSGFSKKFMEKKERKKEKMAEEKIEILGERYHIAITSESEDALVCVFRNNTSWDKLDEETRKQIKRDIQDWGKWRIYKKLKKDLEDRDG